MIPERAKIPEYSKLIAQISANLAAAGKPDLTDEESAEIFLAYTEWSHQNELMITGKHPTNSFFDADNLFSHIKRRPRLEPDDNPAIAFNKVDIIRKFDIREAIPYS